MTLSPAFARYTPARMQPPQTYTSHRRFHPLFHFIAVPILSINVLLQAWQMFQLAGRMPIWRLAWNLLVAIAILIGVVLARYYALRVQDRLIRLEERVRLDRCLPEELRGRIHELSTGQLIALRFCSDEELPDLARAVLDGEVRGREQIKKRVQNWRADHHRI